MSPIKMLTWTLWTLVLAFIASPSLAADYPAPKEGAWLVRDFRFHTGEVLPELRLHYTTIGTPTGEPVLILHGTIGSGARMLTPAFAGELFGPGRPLDASRYFIVLPDAIGTGKSSKPSDGLRMKFPKYDYDDMVQPIPVAHRTLGHPPPPFSPGELDGRDAHMDVGSEVSRLHGCCGANGVAADRDVWP
jgi:homoserine O-acetyltransferase/O-succinyltransferase